MDPTDLSDAQLDQLADQLAGRLPSGTHGDRVVLSRRAFAAAVGGTLGASGLVALGVDPAAAQAAGQVGTSADPVDAFVYDLDVANALQSDLDAGGNALTNVESLSTDELQNVADHIVGSTSELESTFDNLSAGDTVWVGTPSTPYRTTQWLDIDVDGVSVVFQSQYAENGEAVIKVADGANVGGIRIGSNSATERTEIINAGFDGNYANQDSAVKRLHAYYVYDADYTRFLRCYATKTSPYHEHSTGGSGFSTTRDARYVSIENCVVSDIGDRCIQVSGEDIYIRGNRLYDGFDRGIATSMSEDDGSSSAAQRVLIQGNTVKNLSDGSAIGVGGYPILDTNPNGQIVVVGNQVYGPHRSGVKIYGGNHDITVQANTLISGNSDGIRLTSKNSTSKRAKITITGNTVRAPGGRGIHINDQFDTVSIVSNGVFNSADDGIRGVSDDCIIGLNTVQGSGGAGVETTGNDNIVLGNRILASSGSSINDTGTGNQYTANLTGDPN